ncbi:MAG TPA: FAD-dependent oxidoreductase [Thermomicrobiales bacterium]
MPTTGSWDSIIIGGGLLGWSTAYRLVRAGARVLVIDRADAGHATQAGAGIISPGTSFRPLPAFFPFASAAVADYPRLLEELAEDGETDTGYEVCGQLLIARDEDEAARLPEALRLLTERRDQGMGNIGELTRLDSAGARALFPPLADIPGAIHVAGAARVDGRRLRGAIRQASERRGATVLTGDAVPVVEGDRVTGVRVDGHSLAAGSVVLAGGAWSGKLAEQLGFRLPVEPQRGQILHLDVPETSTGDWPIITGFHDHYLLAFRPCRVVMGGTRETGSGFDVRITAGGVREVLNIGLSTAPGLANATIAEIRVGLRPLSADGLPILGRAPGFANLYLCTGHGPSGLQLGPFSGGVTARLILGQDPGVDLTPFAAERFANI